MDVLEILMLAPYLQDEAFENDAKLKREKP
jgi:hypothetical protein